MKLSKIAWRELGLLAEGPQPVRVGARGRAQQRLLSYGLALQVAVKGRATYILTPEGRRQHTLFVSCEPVVDQLLSRMSHVMEVLETAAKTGRESPKTLVSTIVDLELSIVSITSKVDPTELSLVVAPLLSLCERTKQDIALMLH